MPSARKFTPNASIASLESRLLLTRVHHDVRPSSVLLGEFDAAADLWLGCARRWATNDDSRVAAIHWAYMSLLRAGRTEEAARALDLVGPEPDVIENFAYLDLVQLYRGDLSAAALLERDSPNAALEYGLARHLIRTGDAVRGERMLEALTARPDWPAFGVLGAEADLARR